MVLGGCQPAAVFRDGKVIVDPGFIVAAPDDSIWELAKNRLINDEALVAYRTVERNAGALSLALLRVPPGAVNVPLEVLAEANFLGGNIADGMSAEVLDSRPIVVGDYRAVATYGLWTIRPITRQVSQVMIRSPDGLVVITLVGEAPHFDGLVPELDYLLRSFELRSSYTIDPFLLEEVPFSDPDHDPGRFVP